LVATFKAQRGRTAWMAGTSPAMTALGLWNFLPRVELSESWYKSDVPLGKICPYSRNKTILLPSEY
jgi:hypothetical protein